MHQKHQAIGPRADLPSRQLALPGTGFGLLFFIIISTVATNPIAAYADPPPISPLHTFSALPGVEIQISAEGSIQFVDQASSQPILNGWIQTGPRTKVSRPRDETAFSTRAPEGIRSGRRGDSARADDDNDGLVDEDPLDGRDNDGDGLVDEDFAAISDAMVVVDTGPGGRHIEFYHWAYSRLMSAAFFTMSGESDPAEIFDFRLEALNGQWVETEIFSRRHSITGRPGQDRRTAHVTAVSRPNSQGPILWVGAMVLGENINERARVISDRERLDLLHGSTGPDRRETSAVICVAQSWLQLNRLLCESGRVYEGVLDPVTGSKTPWIVPPLCSLCRQSGNPDFSWSLAGQDDLLLSIDIQEGKTGLVDPDLFSLGGFSLGVPVELTWRPRGEEVQTVRWASMTLGLLDNPVRRLSDPFEEFTSLAGHDVAGELTLRFLVSQADQFWSDPSDALQLDGRWLDGRPLRALANRTKGPSVDATEIASNLSHSTTSSFSSPGSHAEPTSGPNSGPPPNQDEDSGRLSLASGLLQGWPNPFRGAIQVQFKIPQTMGEAFQWEEGQEIPAGIEMKAPVNWETGSPFVTVKIYRINGQELVTLFQDYSNLGESAVQWDGTDSYGRSVASGPYLCKLQMDDWSVTRRIVFLR